MRVLAVIFINQVVGPVAFKMALGLVGEAGKRTGIGKTGEGRAGD